MGPLRHRRAQVAPAAARVDPLHPDPAAGVRCRILAVAGSDDRAGAVPLTGRGGPQPDSPRPALYRLRPPAAQIVRGVTP